ncbi:hypothetical protein GCM10023189_03230 [Nibrella saemangeumensis]|uniref:N-acetyltransferase domain-containing protein n=1 Tax=Nibrella saemangeumensis TaxID=1084526 RepID=A0ABP8MCH3_9BACT
MAIHIKPAQPDHQPTVSALLESVQLPVNDLPTGLPGFIVALDDERLIGSAGVESFESIGLLRSVAVDPDYRDHKLGRRLVDAVLETARQQGVREAYLITTTADQYFERYGFERVERNTVPSPVAATQQFSQLCPASAVVMKKSLV